MDAMTDLAENWLNIQRIELQVYADNEPGISYVPKVRIRDRRHASQPRLSGWPIRGLLLNGTAEVVNFRVPAPV